jgi:hypothetical protein
MPPFQGFVEAMDLSLDRQGEPEANDWTSLRSTPTAWTCCTSFGTTTGLMA